MFVVNGLVPVLVVCVERFTTGFLCWCVFWHFEPLLHTFITCKVSVVPPASTWVPLGVSLALVITNNAFLLGWCAYNSAHSPVYQGDRWPSCTWCAWCTWLKLHICPWYLCCCCHVCACVASQQRGWPCHTAAAFPMYVPSVTAVVVAMLI